jgi:hypothetical protein
MAFIGYAVLVLAWLFIGAIVVAFFMGRDRL